MTVDLANRKKHTEKEKERTKDEGKMLLFGFHKKYNHNNESVCK